MKETLYVLQNIRIYNFFKSITNVYLYKMQLNILKQTSTEYVQYSVKCTSFNLLYFNS